LILISGCTFISGPETQEIYNSKIILNETLGLIKNNYCFISMKNINIDSLNSFYSSNISSYNGDEIYKLLFDILSGLKDGHVAFSIPSGEIITPYQSPRNFKDRYSFSLNVVKNYINGNLNVIEDGTIAYGIINQNIGYIFIKDMNGFLTQWYNSFSGVLDFLKNTKGIIIDVRNNAGGISNVSDNILSHFIGKPFLSPAVLDAKGNKTSGTYLQPDKNYYSAPVILLQNGVCFSAAEHFINMMRELEKVTTLGDTTGGGIGNPLKFTISYNIIINLPTKFELTYEGNSIEWNGIEPDIPIQQTKNDLENGKDKQLEKAIDLLTKKLNK
jgi:hypothetical protein